MTNEKPPKSAADSDQSPPNTEALPSGQVSGGVAGAVVGGFAMGPAGLLAGAAMGAMAGAGLEVDPDVAEADPRFREHWQASATRLMYTWEQVRDAYRYGYAAGRQRDRADSHLPHWDHHVEDLRQNWQGILPWEEVESQVRAGWEIAISKS